MDTVTAGSARRAPIIAGGALLLAACAAAPYLIPAGIDFARNLLITATNNYGTRYSEDMSRLIARLTQPYVAMPAGMPQYPVAAAPYPGQGAGASPGTDPGYPAQPYPGYPGGVPIGSASPYGTPGASYPPQPSYPSAPTAPYGPPSGYPAQPAVNPYGAYPATGQPGQAPYPAAPPQPYQYPPTQYGAVPPTGYPPQGAPSSPYPAGVPSGTYPQYGSPPAPAYPAQYPGQPAGAVGQPGYPPVAGYPGQPQYGMQYPPAGIFPRSVPAEPVAADVALVRQQVTAQGRLVVLMNDGEVLRDDPVSPQAGDKFKLVLRANCDCYVYVIAIDGSGWAQGIFPTRNAQATNPVRKGQEYAFPEGANWFALDRVKGVETFYIVVSPFQRPDLEESIARVAGNERPAGRGAGRVESPAVIPDGFGRKESGRATTVRSESGQQTQVTPLAYVAKAPGEPVTVTRWFRHE